MNATAKMAEAYKGFTALVEANLQQQVAAVKARFAQEQAELQTKRTTERERIVESTKNLSEALTQQATLRQQASTQTVQLIDAETNARRAAMRQGQTEQERVANVQRVENDILATKRQTLVQALNEYRQHIDALNAEVNRHLAEVQRIEEAKRQLTMSTEERIREIRRQGMSEYEATEDRKRQITELQQKAREALAQGEFEQARQLAQKAMDLAVQVANTQSAEAKRGAGRASDACAQWPAAHASFDHLSTGDRGCYMAADVLRRRPHATAHVPRRATSCSATRSSRSTTMPRCWRQASSTRRACSS